MERFGGMQKDRLNSGTAKCSNNFLPNQPGLSQSANHNFPFVIEDYFCGFNH